MSAAANDFFNLIRNAKNILTLLPPNPSDDAIATSFGLMQILEKQKKKTSLLFCETFPERLSFLKKPKQIIDTLDGSRDFVMMFNTNRNRILGVKTEETKDNYIIRITPQSGSIDPRDFSFIPADFNYDLIIIINANSLEALSDLYQKNTDLFFEVPKVNIDNQSSNEQYGQVNLVDMTASSVAEIVTECMLEHQEEFLDKDIAQALLTGIISATESFQKPNTTPNAMILAAKLMKYKADQPTIIRYLYKTKSLAFLKLWGRVMARLNWDKENKLAWSLISIEDFVKSRANITDVPYVLEQIKENFSEGQIFGVFYNETPKIVIAQLRFSNEKVSQELAELFSLSANQRSLQIRFENMNLIEAERKFLEKLETL